MSSGAEPSNNGNTTSGLKAVGNQAKKQDEAVTRQGTQKMKFVPTLPSRRKKPETEAKQEEPAPAPTPTPKVATDVLPSERGGRGRGRGRGRGASRGAAPRPEAQMTASGPFAMGPTMGGSKKNAVRATYVAPRAEEPSSSSAIGLVPDEQAKPSKGKEKAVKVEEVEDIEVYSDPDEGVQIVDMNAVRTMDWMAPESLRRDKLKKKKEALSKIAEKREMKGQSTERKDVSNALHLSESDEEEETEDLMEHFAVKDDDVSHQEKLYFFQFPHNFAQFKAPGDEQEAEPMIIDKPDPGASEPTLPAAKEKKVTFAPDVKQEAPGASTSTLTKEDNKEKKFDGLIGQLEVHRSGMIKLRLNNGMLLDVTAATQPSFLQQAVYLNEEEKKLCVLGEVNRRFVVSPDVDKLLEDLSVDNTNSKETTLMDTS